VTAAGWTRPVFSTSLSVNSRWDAGPELVDGGLLEGVDSDEDLGRSDVVPVDNLDHGAV